MGKNKEGEARGVEGHDSPLGPNPFDTAFKTLKESCTDLLIPVINELFHTQYRMDDDILLLSEEQHVRDEKGARAGRAMDSHILLGGEKYHIECQANRDCDMELRIMEYDSQVARLNARKRDGVCELRYSKSAVLHLRNQSGIPDIYQIRLFSENGESIMRTAPVLKVQSYGKKEMFDKKLLFLVPFYVMRFEERMADINKDPRKLSVFKRECQNIYDRLVRLHENGEIDGKHLGILAEMTDGIIKAVTRKADNVRKEVAHMGGYVKRTLTEELIEYGEKQGMKQGMRQAVAVNVERMMRKLDMPFEEACKVLDVPEAEWESYRGMVEEEAKKAGQIPLVGRQPHRAQQAR